MNLIKRKSWSKFTKTGNYIALTLWFKTLGVGLHFDAHYSWLNKEISLSAHILFVGFSFTYDWSNLPF